MKIYKVYRDYGQYEGEGVIGYFLSETKAEIVAKKATENYFVIKKIVIDLRGKAYLGDYYDIVIETIDVDTDTDEDL